MRKVLMHFYEKTRPWGFWKPIHDKVVANQPDFAKNKGFMRDMGNVALGIITQTALVVLPIYLILHNNLNAFYSIIVIAVCVLILKKTWWDKIKVEKDISVK